MLPLSNLSSVTEDSLSSVLNKDKSTGASTSIYSCSEDEYRQCRRARNTAIANQQRQNINDNSSRYDAHSSTSETPDNRPRPTLFKFWNTVRTLQLSIRHRRQTGRYIRQINGPEFDDRRATTATTPLETINEDDSVFRRVPLEVAEPVLNELPVAVPLAPRPTFISLTSIEQEDEPDTIPCTGQTLCKVFCRRKFSFALILFISTYRCQIT